MFSADKAQEGYIIILCFVTTTLIGAAMCCVIKKNKKKTLAHPGLNHFRRKKKKSQAWVFFTVETTEMFSALSCPRSLETALLSLTKSTFLKNHWAHFKPAVNKHYKHKATVTFFNNVKLDCVRNNTLSRWNDTEYGFRHWVVTVCVSGQHSVNLYAEAIWAEQKVCVQTVIHVF